MEAPLCVITGAPGAGKTTLLAELADNGYRVVHEAARTLLEEGARCGETVRASREDERAFQLRIFQRQTATEATLDRRTTTFLDRGIPDTVAFFRLHGWPLPAHVVSMTRACRYDAVFLLRRIPDPGPDRARIETGAERDVLERLLLETYECIDAPMFVLPVRPLQERTRAVLGHLRRLGLTHDH